MTKTITIQYLNDVKPGKKMASIKTPDGEYFSVQPAVLKVLKQGATYEIEYTSREYQGKMYHTLTNFQEKPATTAQNAPQSSGTAPKTSGNGWDERSHRIERQHSQSAAIDWFKLKAQIAAMTGEVIKMPTTLELREMTSWLQRDISHSCEKVETPEEPEAEEPF